MVGRIPSAIVRAANNIVINVPSAEFSGISNPKYQGAFGYHHSRNHLRIYNPNDPSMKHPLDKLGADDACSALDIKLSPSMMRLVTKRLIDACRNNDPYARGIAEIGGTLNGTSTIAWDEKDQRLEYGWDSTHLWHIHVSGWRKYADDEAAWMDIAKLFAGELGGDDMALDEPLHPEILGGTTVRQAITELFLSRGGRGQINATLTEARNFQAEARKFFATGDPAGLVEAIGAASVQLADIRRMLEEHAAPPPPEPELVLGPPLYGLDLNPWRGDVDWPAVADWRNGDARIAFVTLKSSGAHAAGQDVLAAHWAREAPEMAAAGIPLVGACHRLHLAATAEVQVQELLDALDVIGGYAGRLVQLDCEAGDPDMVRAFMEEWNGWTDDYPVLGYLPDWRESGWVDSDVASYGFAAWWASEYVEGTGDPVSLATLITEEQWHPQDQVAPAILQYTQAAVVPGVSSGCDANLFRGTLADLRELATRPG